MAKDCYKQAAHAGLIRPQVNLGYIALRCQQYNKALKHFRVSTSAKEQQTASCSSSMLLPSRSVHVFSCFVHLCQAQRKRATGCCHMLLSDLLKQRKSAAHSLTID